MHLTDKVIREANYEGESFLGESGKWEWSQYTLWDNAAPGLGVRVSPNNSKVFILTKLTGDKRESITLGKFGVLSLEDARAAALENLAKSPESTAVLPPDSPASDPAGQAASKASAKPTSTRIDAIRGRRADRPTRPGSRNRRKHPRLRVVMVIARSKTGTAEIMDLSRTGMALESTHSIPVGEVHGFFISNKSHQFEVDGRVQWCHATSAPGSAPDEHQRIYQLGVAFTKIHTKDPQGIFAGLRTAGNQPGTEFFVDPESPVEAGDSRPLITIVTPRDGSTVYSSPVTVLGIVQGSLDDQPIEVEGVAARIDGEWFEAEIPLVPGGNKISAVIPSKNSVPYRSPVIEVSYEPTDED